MVGFCYRPSRRVVASRPTLNYDSIIDELFTSEELPRGGGHDEIVTAAETHFLLIEWGVSSETDVLFDGQLSV